MTPEDFDFLLDQLIVMRNLSVDAEARGHWWDTFSNVESPVFREAIRRMIAEDDHYPSPAHLRGICREIMNERLSRALQPTPPSDLTQDEYSRWEREWRRQIVRGTPSAEAEALALEARSGAPKAEAKSNGRIAIEGTIMDF